MSDLGWRADGIQRARAAGGVELETYRRPGFGGASACDASMSLETAQASTLRTIRAATTNATRHQTPRSGDDR